MFPHSVKGAALLLAMALAACSSNTPQESRESVADQLQSGQWKVSFIGKTPVFSASNKPNHAHLVFAEDNKVYGADGCNRLNGSYRVDGKSLSFGQMASTMMACMNQEGTDAKLHEALSETEQYRLHGKHLLLLNNRGDIILQLLNDAPVTP